MTATNNTRPTHGHRDGLYRIKQVALRFTARVTEADLVPVRALLPPGGQTLFLTMARGDQRHSLNVYRALLSTGCTDGDLLQAALLHDSGKGSHRIRFWVRPAVVILHRIAPCLLNALAGPSARAPVASWRRPFRDAWFHAELGARLAEEAGMSPRVVTMIREHHDPYGPAAALHAVDEQN